jgi:hypothetical protein
MLFCSSIIGHPKIHRVCISYLVWVRRGIVIDRTSPVSAAGYKARVTYCHPEGLALSLMVCRLRQPYQCSQ